MSREDDNNPVHLITHAIISNQIALNHNEAIKHTPYYKQDLKHKINILMPVLIKAEPEYDAFFNSVEGSTTQVYDAYDQFIKQVASVKIWDCENITAIIEAYKKDKKSLQGLVKKILRK